MHLNVSTLRPHSPLPTPRADKPTAPKMPGGGVCQEGKGKERRVRRRGQEKSLGRQANIEPTASQPYADSEPSRSLRHSDWDHVLDAAYSRLDAEFSKNSQVVFEQLPKTQSLFLHTRIKYTCLIHRCTDSTPGGSAYVSRSTPRGNGQERSLLVHMHTHARTRARTHTPHTHSLSTPTHTHTHNLVSRTRSLLLTPPLSLSLPLSPSLVHFSPPFARLCDFSAVQLSVTASLVCLQQEQQ